MSSIFRAMAYVMLLASCSGGSSYNSAPRNLDDACSIVSERPEYLRAFQAVERKYGVPVPSLMAIIYQESKFIGNNRTPHRYALGVIPVGRQSSAFGYSQALDGTWEEYQDGPGGRRARRDDIGDATDFMGWYMVQTVEETGVPINMVTACYGQCRQPSVIIGGNTGDRNWSATGRGCEGAATSTRLCTCLLTSVGKRWRRDLG